MRWNPVNGMFIYSNSIQIIAYTLNKREMLLVIESLFDTHSFLVTMYIFCETLNAMVLLADWLL